jgi:hypothetical protein
MVLIENAITGPGHTVAPPIRPADDDRFTESTLGWQPLHLQSSLLAGITLPHSTAVSSPPR